MGKRGHTRPGEVRSGTSVPGKPPGGLPRGVLGWRGEAKTWAGVGDVGGCMWIWNSENHRNLRTRRSSPVKSGRVTRSRARKQWLTPAPWSPSELSDPIRDSGCKSTPRPSPLQSGELTRSCSKVLGSLSVHGEHSRDGCKRKAMFHHRKNRTGFEPQETSLNETFFFSSF